MIDWDFLSEKRKEVLKEIKPYCEVFGITDYDYFVNKKTGGEVLKLNNTYIGCTANSIMAVIDELIGYVFVMRYCRNRQIGAFRTQTLNNIKCWWIDCPEWIKEREQG